MNISQTLSASVPGRFRVTGGYLKVLEADAALDSLRLYKNGQEVYVEEDAPVGFYTRVAFDEIQIDVTSSNAIRLIVAPIEAGVDTQTVQGTIDVGSLPDIPDSRDAEVAADEAFVAIMTGESTVTSTQSHQFQIANPGGSGKVLLLDDFVVNVNHSTLTTMNSLRFGAYIRNAVTDLGTVDANQPLSVKDGVTASVARTSYHLGSTAVPTVLHPALWRSRLFFPQRPVYHRFKNPPSVSAGRSFFFYSADLSGSGISLYISARFRQVTA